MGRGVGTGSLGWLVDFRAQIPWSEPPRMAVKMGGWVCARSWKAGQAYQRNPIDWSLVDSMHDHRMAECMQSYVCLVLISVRDKVMVAGVFHIRDKSHNL